MKQVVLDTAERLAKIAFELDALRNKGGFNKEAEFYEEIRRAKLFGPQFDRSEFSGCQEILKDCAKANWPVSWTAYALATAYHETAGTMKPVKEYGGRSYYTKLYDVQGQNPERARKYGNTSPGDGPKYCGRGYVQLTWKNNYKKAGEELGFDLVNNPDLALDRDIAGDIMIKGMQEGWFVPGHTCERHLPKVGDAYETQFKNARRIINGTDKAGLIADYALDFQKALRLGEWK